ncbi:MAG: Rrf2 family transcriptional regulator [Christensenellaceae bacterium]|jgi:Rrf2 family protein|nr:Rrf2 family transcriptional regulator [Christensenellaceae bacterium]
MKISTKSRYGLAFMVCLAEKINDVQTASDIAFKLNISKLYLEQVIQDIRNTGLITSIRGTRGGYKLNKSPSSITIWEILKVTEAMLADDRELCPQNEAFAYIYRAIDKKVLLALDKALYESLSKITLQDVIDAATESGEMFYI